MRGFAFAFAFLASFVLRADMYPDASNATYSVTAYGVRGDCTTDDTAAIQAAVNANPGKRVWVPKPAGACYKITAAISLANGQRLTGEGAEIQQATSLAAVVTATGTGAVVEGLTLRAGGGRVSQTDGSGVLLTGCTHCKVRGNTITNSRGGGVTVSNSNDNEITNNTFLNAAVSGATHDTDAGWDIQILNASSRNLVSGNLCMSGTGAGIKVQSVFDGEIAEDNVITGNRVANSLAYGIIVYRNYNGAPPAPQSVKRTVVTNNNIENVLGTLLNTATGTYAYGAGIYLQGAEDAVVTGNSIDRAHSGGVAFASNLAPGGIGLANMSRATITGNSITNSGYNGIDASNSIPSKADPEGALIISGNNIINTALRGIRFRNNDHVSFTDNIINVAGSTGIEANLALTNPNNNYVISGNKVSAVAATAMSFKYVSNIQITGNVIDTPVVSGIAVSLGSNIGITGNLVNNLGGVGIDIGSTASGVLVANNSVIGNTASGSIGVRLDALATLGQNRVTDNAQNWVGDYSVLRGTSESIAVGNIGGGEDNLMTYVLPAASLVRMGDTLHIMGWGNAANNANAKTLKMYFGNTLIMTANLTASQLSSWSVDAYILNRSNAADSQRSFVTFTQSGTVTQVTVTQTDLVEIEANAITAKFTAGATANDDIRQFGIITTFRNG